MSLYTERILIIIDLFLDKQWLQKQLLAVLFLAIFFLFSGYTCVVFYVTFNMNIATTCIHRLFSLKAVYVLIKYILHKNIFSPGLALEFFNKRGLLINTLTI